MYLINLNINDKQNMIIANIHKNMITINTVIAIILSVTIILL